MTRAFDLAASLSLPQSPRQHKNHPTEDHYFILHSGSASMLGERGLATALETQFEEVQARIAV